jgi:hypothetical protein
LNRHWFTDHLRLRFDGHFIAAVTAWQDKLIVDAWYDVYAPYIESSLAARDQVIRAELGYLDPKEFPQAKNANPREFVDNSFVENLEKSGFLATIGLDR